MSRQFAQRLKVLSRERGAIHKDWGGRVPIVLVFPNSYHLGMSSLGFQTIYGLWNSFRDFVCERAFWEPQRDHKGLGEPPLSLESGRPLTDFALVAFSASFELDYPHIVQVLRTSGIPALASQRDQRHPLVLVGGPAVSANPEPLASIIDAFVIGEAEPVLPRLAQVMVKEVGADREHLLQTLVEVPGVYVPRMTGQERPVARQQAQSLEGFATTSVVLTPDTELGERYLMEIGRGCAWACGFCLAGHIFRPLRTRTVASLVAQAQEGLKLSPRLGLVSAAISDYPHLGELATALSSLGAQLSVSSLRPRPLPESLLAALAAGGAHTLTMAPEAGPALRLAVGKRLRDEDFLEAAERASAYPFRHLKLYFMVGLPEETESDLAEIVRLTLEMKASLERRGSLCQLSLNVSPFVPKAQTPFEREPLAPAQVLEERLRFLSRELRHKGIKVSGEGVGWSVIQGLLSRGDSSLGRVLVEMEENTLSGWRRALAAAGVEREAIHRPLPPHAALPWDHLRQVETAPVELAQLAGESA
ncbi:MAG: radical SAM protein [Chloroflexi bacterium]|nr:radical SAM protein [Chloroflexota bacterium]